MMQTANRRKKGRGCASAQGGYRAFRREKRSDQVERHLWALGLGADVLTAEPVNASEERRLARALREQRRAARSGGSGYDPVRHLVLARLARLPLRAGRTRSPRISAGVNAAGPSPSSLHARTARQRRSAPPSDRQVTVRTSRGNARKS